MVLVCLFPSWFLEQLYQVASTGLPPEYRSHAELEHRLGQVDCMHWRQARLEARQQHRVQVIMFRFQHRCQRYLHSLEDRWSQTFVHT